MKKIWLLVLSVFFLSGCTANYDLIYEDGILRESLSVIDSKDSNIDGQSFFSVIDQYYNNVNVLVDYKVQPGDMSKEEALSLYDYYTKNIINSNGDYGINLRHTYDVYKEYANSSLVNTLFNEMQVTENNITASSTKNVFGTYKYLDEVTVSFKTDKRVIDTNCDEEKDNIYYWYINRDNYFNKTIKINISSENNIKLNEEDSNKFLSVMFITLGVIFIVGIIVACIKIINSNKK